MFVTPLPIAKAALAASMVLFAMALISGAGGILVFYSLLAVILAGQLVGKAVKS